MTRSLLARPLLVAATLGALLAGCTDPPDDPDPAACRAMAPGESWLGRDGSRVTIVVTNPAPPARFTNWWAVRIEDREGAPMFDPARLTVSAFMPEHGHGAPIAPGVTAEVDGLIVGPLELWMPGQWEIRFDVDGDRTIVPVCIAE